MFVNAEKRKRGSGKHQSVWDAQNGNSPASGLRCSIVFQEHLPALLEPDFCATAATAATAEDESSTPGKLGLGADMGVPTFHFIEKSKVFSVVLPDDVTQPVSVGLPGSAGLFGSVIQPGSEEQPGSAGLPGLEEMSDFARIFSCGDTCADNATANFHPCNFYEFSSNT